MRTVILCEGRDDLWFIAYYLNKTIQWTQGYKKDRWNYKISEKGTISNSVLYMNAPHSEDTLAIVAVDGEANLAHKTAELLDLIQQQPANPIHAIVIFRDCDDRNQEELAESMGVWFSCYESTSSKLCNQKVAKFQTEIEETDITLSVLPIVIPFDEPGAIETLLMNAIASENEEGACIVNNAKSFVQETQKIVKIYLKKQRERTKAAYSATLSITNPTRSRDDFRTLMMSTNWEKSDYISSHMKCLLDLLNKK